MITASARWSRAQSGTFFSLPNDSDTCAGIEAFARDVSHDRSGNPRRAGCKKPGILFESRPTATRFLPHESGRLRLTQGVTGTSPRLNYRACASGDSLGAFICAHRAKWLEMDR